MLDPTLMFLICLAVPSIASTRAKGSAPFCMADVGVASFNLAMGATEMSVPLLRHHSSVTRQRVPNK